MAVYVQVVEQDMLYVTKAPAWQQRMSTGAILSSRAQITATSNSAPAFKHRWTDAVWIRYGSSRKDVILADDIWNRRVLTILHFAELRRWKQSGTAAKRQTNGLINADWRYRRYHKLITGVRQSPDHDAYLRWSAGALGRPLMFYVSVSTMSATRHGTPAIVSQLSQMGRNVLQRNHPWRRRRW